MIDGEAAATAGQLTVDVVTQEGASELMPYAKATFTLEGVTFEADDGSTGLLEDRVIEDVVVGWLPG